MTRFIGKSVRLVLGTVALAAGFAWDGSVDSVVGISLETPAFAVIGRPLTPLSYAGVARRTTRRAVAVGAAAAAAPPPQVVVVPAPTTTTCVDKVGPNGVITRTCY
jgi:hypothetical protein